jgi:hypothetical protein
MRISLHPGVWAGATGLALFGGIAATQSLAPDQIITFRLAEAAIVLGALLFLWGIKWNGRHWWDRQWLSFAAVHPRRGLYVGSTLVSDTDLDANHYLDVSFRGYNGTAQTVRYGGCSGSAAIQFANTPGGFELQPPIFMFGDAPCLPGAEFTLSFHLVFTAAQVVEFRTMQAQGVTPQIMFGRLAISMRRRWGQPLRLPLWDGVSLQGSLVGGRIVCVVGHATIHSTASVG